MSDDEICGEPTGEDGNGPPCQRTAGWGRDEDGGPCVDHINDRVRPRKLTHELQERLAGDLEAGIPVKHAAPKNGISTDTYYRWVDLGKEQDEGLLSDFSDRVTRAQAHGTGQILQDAVTIAREERDARTLLRAYTEIVGAQEDSLGDTEEAIPLVVPENAIPDSN